MRRRRAAAVIGVGVAVCIAGGVALNGCRMVVTPPDELTLPVDVYLVDYGRHSSLLLPHADGDRLVEFTFGEWNWFALDRSSWLDAFPTLFWPTRGTLGRIEWHVESNLDAVRRHRPSESVYVIAVEETEATALLERLEERFETHADTKHYQPLYDLQFVHDDEAYSLFHNCNQVAACWLRDVGCTVRGYSLLAEFEIEQAGDDG